MARTMVTYWQHVGTGEVFAVRVDADGQIVSACGPLAPADIEAALFGDPARRRVARPAHARQRAHRRGDRRRFPGPCARCHPRPRGGVQHPPALALRPPGHRTPRR